VTIEAAVLEFVHALGPWPAHVSMSVPKWERSKRARLRKKYFVEDDGVQPDYRLMRCCYGYIWCGDGDDDGDPTVAFTVDGGCTTLK
jgi:hypothetical protein